jgi:hypothetical protein
MENVFLTTFEGITEYKVNISAYLAINQCANILRLDHKPPVRPTTHNRVDNADYRELLKAYNMEIQVSHGIIIRSLSKMKNLQKQLLEHEKVAGKIVNGHTSWFVLMSLFEKLPVSANQLDSRTEFHINNVKLGENGLLQKPFDELEELYSRLSEVNSWSDFKKIRLLYNLVPKTYHEFIDIQVAAEKDYTTVVNLLISKQHALLDRENQVMKSTNSEQSILKKAEESVSEKVNFANYAEVHRKRRDYDSDDDSGKEKDGNDSDSGRKHFKNRDANPYPHSNRPASSSSFRSSHYQQPNNFSSSRNSRKIICFNCQKEGHKRPECPERSSSYGPKKGKYNDNK